MAAAGKMRWYASPGFRLHSARQRRRRHQIRAFRAVNKPEALAAMAGGAAAAGKPRHHAEMVEEEAAVAVAPGAASNR